MSHRTVRQIPGSGSVNRAHLEKKKKKRGQTQCVLCVSVSILSVIFRLNKVYSGHRENQAQPCESREMRKFTAGVEEEEIRTVYVPCPIHLH